MVDYAAVYDGHNGDSAARYLVQHLFQVFETLLQEQIAELTGETKSENLSAYLLDNVWIYSHRGLQSVKALFGVQLMVRSVIPSNCTIR